MEYSDDGNKIVIALVKEDELCQKLLDNLKEMLISLSQDYPKNIKVESEE